MTERDVCPECGGDGFLLWLQAGEWERRLCESCDGSGEALLRPVDHPAIPGLDDRHPDDTGIDWTAELGPK